MDSRGLIANNLRRVRLLRRLSQEELAFRANVDRTYVSGLERKNRNPTVDVLDRLARALGIKTAALFESKSATPIPPNLPRGRRRKRPR